MKITKITIGRLFNLGNFEHVRYELSCEVPEGESAATAMVGMEKIISALNPKPPFGVPDNDETQRAQYQLDEMRKLDDDNFNNRHYGYKGTRQEYTTRCEMQIIEGVKKRKAWELRAMAARHMLQDLGGAANWKDAKLDWENDDL